MTVYALFFNVALRLALAHPREAREHATEALAAAIEMQRMDLILQSNHLLEILRR